MLRATLADRLHARPAHWTALLLFIVVGLVFYWPYLGRLPEGLHAWAQADRLALALNFYDFGLDFWHPRTSALVSIGGVTGVEFPLQPYLAAVGGVLLGREAVSPLFRLLNVVVAMVGFWYLFRLVYERTGSFVAGLVPGAFLLSSPTYGFYASTYLPDPFSLSLSFVGYYYWLRFFNDGRFRSFAIGIGVLTLASLVKTTTALHLGAVSGITMLWASQEPALLTSAQRRWFLVLVAGALGTVVAFILHNQTLNTTYASLQFLAEARPITNASVRRQVWGSILHHWLLEYATRLMYGMLAGAALLVLVRLRASLRRPLLPLSLLVLAAAAIAVVFFKLMGAQFGVHDYYLICSFGPPVVLLLVLALLVLGSWQGWPRRAANLGMGMLVLLLLGSGYRRLARRYSDDYPPFSQYYTHAWMRGGAAQLRQLAVPATARILVLDDPAPNLGLVYFDRRGLTWKPDLGSLHSANLLGHMAPDSLSYLIMSPAAYAKLAPEHIELAADFEILGQRPAVVLHRRNIAYPW